MKRVLGLFISVFAVLLMSHNVFASNTPLNYLNNYQTSLTGLGDTQGRIRFNDLYTISGSNASYYYLEHGEFQNVAWNWYYGHEYDVIIVLTFEVPNSFYIWNGPIYVDGNNYHTTDDDFNVSQSCDSSTCKYTIIHDLKVSGDSNGQEYVKISNFILKMKSASNITFSGKFNLSAYLIDNVDEALAFRTELMDELEGIHSDTTDIVDTLGEINDKLDALDSNADANAQAWENMQDTDGLVDIGDDSQALSIVGSLNSVLGQVRDIPAAVGCTINANFPGRINLGDLNFCTGKDTLGNVVAFSATVIFLFISFFIVLRVIKKVIRLISWCRKN